MPLKGGRSSNERCDSTGYARLTTSYTALRAERPDNCCLFGERRAGSGPTVVLLHAGVTDRRSWRRVIDTLQGDLDTVVYDRRGFGETPASPTTFSHVVDLDWHKPKGGSRNPRVARSGG